MKTKISKAKVKGVGEIETPETNPLILHFLSPIERAAYRNKFRPFKYNLDGVVLDVDGAMCKSLYYRSREHIGSIRYTLYEFKVKLLKKSDERIRRWLLKPLKHQELPTRIFHILNSNYCRKMEDVARKGESGIYRMRGMGKEGLTYLVNLFFENGCGSLFL
jgi:hypothetical protein